MQTKPKNKPFVKMAADDPFGEDYYLGTINGHEVEITKCTGAADRREGYRYHWSTSADGWKCRFVRRTRTADEAVQKARKFIESL